jgi:hypothetical protein
LGILGILGIENRKLKYFLPSFPADNNNQKIYLFIYLIFFDLTAAGWGAQRGQTGAMSSATSFLNAMSPVSGGRG